MEIFALKKTRASGRNISKVFNPVVKLVLENQPFRMPEPAEKPSLHSWYPPNPRAQASLKDYILVKQRLRPSVLDTRVFRGANLDSDHRLVVMSLRLKLKRKPRQRSGMLFDVHLLKQVERRGEFLNTIWSAFEGRSGRGDVKKQWTDLKKASVDAAEQHLHQRRQPQKEWISTP